MNSEASQRESVLPRVVKRLYVGALFLLIVSILLGGVADWFGLQAISYFMNRAPLALLFCCCIDRRKSATWSCSDDCASCWRPVPVGFLHISTLVVVGSRAICVRDWRSIRGLAAASRRISSLLQFVSRDLSIKQDLAFE